MSPADTEHMAYAGYCGDCGRMVAAAVDDPMHRSDTAKFLSEMIRDGCSVGRVTCQTVRDGPLGCTDDCACKFCEKRRSEARRAKVANADLFGETTNEGQT